MRRDQGWQTPPSGLQVQFAPLFTTLHVEPDPQCSIPPAISQVMVQVLLVQCASQLFCLQKNVQRHFLQSSLSQLGQEPLHGSPPPVVVLAVVVMAELLTVAVAPPPLDVVVGPPPPMPPLAAVVDTVLLVTDPALPPPVLALLALGLPSPNTCTSVPHPQAASDIVAMLAAAAHRFFTIALTRYRASSSKASGKRWRGIALAVMMNDSMRVLACGFVVTVVACTGGADNGNGATGQGGATGQTSSTTQSVSSSQTGQGGMGGQGGFSTFSGGFGGCDGGGGHNGCADAGETTRDAIYKCGGPPGEVEACVTLTVDDNSVVTAITESSNGNIPAEMLGCIEKELIGICVAVDLCDGQCGERCYCVLGI